MGNALTADLLLRPRVSAELQSILSAPAALFSMVEALGSPLNVIVPAQIVKNASEYRSVFAKHHLTGDIFFAHKANRSSALVRCCCSSLRRTATPVRGPFRPQRRLPVGNPLCK